ncbi:MAG: hypothetical protein KDD25_00895 [Bdellovibrionales bacterium]|nr:hypothetical protein [Bdellovibrionales bacterium]
MIRFSLIRFGLVMIALGIFSSQATATEYLRCKLLKVDSTTNEATVLEEFCNAQVKNQNQLRTTVIPVGEKVNGKSVWELVIQNLYPTIRYRVLSFSEEFLAMSVYHKIDTEYQVTFKGYQMDCHVDLNSCSRNESDKATTAGIPKDTSSSDKQAPIMNETKMPYQSLQLTPLEKEEFLKEGRLKYVQTAESGETKVQLDEKSGQVIPSSNIEPKVNP